MIADSIQTKKIVANDNYYESNFIMGKNPSIRKQNIYFAATYAAVTAASYFLPAKWRKPVIIGASMVQVSYVSNNLSAGFNVKI